MIYPPHSIHFSRNCSSSWGSLTQRSAAVTRRESRHRPGSFAGCLRNRNEPPFNIWNTTIPYAELTCRVKWSLLTFCCARNTCWSSSGSQSLLDQHCENIGPPELTIKINLTGPITMSTGNLSCPVKSWQIPYVNLAECKLGFWPFLDTMTSFFHIKAS